VGCIMAELLSKEPLFKGKTEIEQLDKVMLLLLIQFDIYFIFTSYNIHNVTRNFASLLS
jgi:hypothetical protein